MSDRETEEPLIEEPLVDENGVDLTLIREFLDLTPAQRLRSLENYVNTLAKVRVIPRAADVVE